MLPTRRSPGDRPRPTGDPDPVLLPGAQASQGRRECIRATGRCLTLSPAGRLHPLPLPPGNSVQTSLGPRSSQPTARERWVSAQLLPHASRGWRSGSGAQGRGGGCRPRAEGAARLPDVGRGRSGSTPGREAAASVAVRASPSPWALTRLPGSRGARADSPWRRIGAGFTRALRVAAPQK